MKQLVLSVAVLAMGNVCMGMNETISQPAAIKDNPVTDGVLNSNSKNDVLIIGSGIPANLLAAMYRPRAEITVVKIGTFSHAKLQ